MKKVAEVLLMILCVLNTTILMYLSRTDSILHLCAYITLMVFQVVLMLFGIKLVAKKKLRYITTYLPAFNIGILCAMTNKIV